MGCGGRSPARTPEIAGKSAEDLAEGIVRDPRDGVLREVQVDGVQLQPGGRPDLLLDVVGPVVLAARVQHEAALPRLRPVHGGAVYARANGHATTADVFVDFMNKVVRSHGKRTVIWNWWDRRHRAVRGRCLRRRG